MLRSDELDTLSNSIVDVYDVYMQSVINDIARRLANGSIASAAWQMQRLSESGKVYQNAVKELSQLTGKSEKELFDIFQKAGVKSLKFDDAIYKEAGLNPLPLNLSPAMLNVLKAGLLKTQGIMSNLTMTTAINAQQSFIKNADLAYMQISTGSMSYDQAIRAAIKQSAADGLSVIDYASGHVDKLDVAMRRTVLTGITQTTGKIQENRADEMGSNLVAVSAHAGARPTHAAWQGKVYSLSGGTKKYPNFVEETGYGTVTGLAGVNCRHSFYPFFEGISENAYSRSELAAMNNAKVKLDGGKVGTYDATQIQRGIERQIRFWKRQEGALDAAKLDNSFEAGKVKFYQAQMRTFIKQTELQRQRNREQVIG